MSDHNFIDNGSFKEELTGWVINDERKVTHQEGQWQGEMVGFMNAVNMGEGSQEITLAAIPRPEPGKADYMLIFWYEAVRLPPDAVGKLRITPGLGGEKELILVPSRKAETEQEMPHDGPLLDLNLSLYEEPLSLDPAETTVTFAVISPDNGGVGRPGAVRFTFAQLLLYLEALQLDSLTVDGESQDPGEPLRLCFGGDHEIALRVSVDNAWHGTSAGLLVENAVVNPDGLLNASPPWGIEHRIDEPWTIFCQRKMEDTEIERTLAVRSQYTADKYLLHTICGHFRLDVVAVREAAYYPVIDLNQSVELVVQVLSHFTRMPLANREVTFTLESPGTELLRQNSDENGEVRLTWTPDTEGDWKIEAKVGSYYKPEEALHTFDVRVLKADPWLSAKFSLDGPPREWIWGEKTGYPCRGASHEMQVVLPGDHALSGTELAVHWNSEDTPGGAGVTLVPEFGAGKTVEGNEVVWSMACENRRDSDFEFTVRCSKLLDPSPPQKLHLSHNSLVINDPRQSSKFPAVGGPDLMLSVDVHSKVPGVGAVSGVKVFWRIDAGPETELPTGVNGRVQFPFKPVAEGDFVVTVRVDSDYDASDPAHEFNLVVLGENPWAKLAAVTLDGRSEGSVGHICFRNAPEVELKIMPVEDHLIGELLTVELVNESGPDLKFDVRPDPVVSRPMTREGLSYQVSSTSSISSRFQLIVRHDDLDPNAQQGILLSQVLQEEGTLTLDEVEVPAENTVYACRGAKHASSFTPGADSPITGLMMAAKLKEGDDFAMRLTPEAVRKIESAGLAWELDATSTTNNGEQGVVFNLPEAGFDFPVQPVSLGHNRVVITEVREPSFDPVVGETVDMQIKTQSFYTQREVPGLLLTFRHGEVSTPVPTLESGWAVFHFTATRAGPVEVIATVPSPYDGPAGAVSHTFSFMVLPVRELDAAHVPSTTLPEEE
ncbi:hypothetical protein PMI21_03043 [Pseudomonas sp. GM18]|uniref:hypothetical protein n=1 Tax=Pseudomonas sp. GM18 TaxID=1144324 RepID=UPI0002722A96|nr:hypothetical protein [Pseudomonas sp. GM18]EJM16116.1 hypothetical protein PMI21_03043 [Pseudomonas sp. GM18]